MYVVTLTDTSIKYSCQSREDTVWVVVRDCTVGIGQQSAVNSPQIKIYPNPVQHTLYVEFADPAIRIATFEVFDIHGRLHYRQAGDAQQINIGTLPQGIYFYKVITTNNQVARGKFVKQ